MPASTNTRKALQALAAFVLPPALAAALLYVYDAYIFWQPRAYPVALASVTLCAAGLTLLLLWARGERGPGRLLRKTLLSLLLSPGVSLIGIPAIINNGIYGGGKPGPAIALGAGIPLASAYALAQCALLFTALRGQGRRAGARALLGGFAAPFVVFGAVSAVNYAGSFAPRRPEIVPVFPEAQAAAEPAPYEKITEGDEGMETIWLEAGTYTALELPSLSNAVYQAKPGGEVIITGAEEIAGWRADRVNGVACWSTAIEGGYFTSLYHPDPEKQLSRPRYPAEGYLFVDHMDGARAALSDEEAKQLWDLTRAHTSFFAKEGDLRQFHALPDVVLRVLHNWKDEITNLVSYDDAARELVWQRPAAMSVKPNDRYFLENVLEELKEPGQWYLDRETSKLYYIPFAGENMASTVLYAGVNERLLTVDKAENVTFRGITFRDSAWTMPNQNQYGIEGMDSSQAAIGVNPCVLVTNSTGVKFENCKFNNIGATALKFGEGVRDSGVEGCEFTRIGGNAVFIEGQYENPDSGITVRNNLIAHYGRRFFNAIGVLNIHAHHVEISHNEIFDGYYTGVSSGWVWGYAENPTDYVTIENNLIYQIGQGWLSDMGGIYTLGMQPHSAIRGNVIHDVAADPLQGGYGGWGIYPDEGSTGQLIEKNLVYRCGSQSFHQHYGKENLVRNNIFAFSGEGQVRVSRKEDHTSAIFERNIIVSDGQPMYTSVEKGKFRDDGNLYYDYANPRRIFSGDGGELGIAQMRRKGYYNNALVADPLFRDPKNADFTLALNSPAVTELGFEVWDYGQAGRAE